MKIGAARQLDLESQNPTPESFLEEIHTIFNSGTLRGAREIAERGLALYSDHPDLQRLHYALRLFEVRVNPSARISDPRPNYEWLEKNWAAYQGKWVGLDKGELVAAADTLEEVLQALEGRDPKSSLVHHLID